MKRRSLFEASFGATLAAATPSGMEPIDYGRSFLQGKWAENRVRFWVESRTRIIGPEVIDYYQCASCKSENTFAPKELFHKENYDFLPVFGPEDGVIFRRKAWLNSDYRQVRKSAEMWEGQTYKLVKPRGARLLRSNREIREATHAGVPIVAQTELADPSTGLRAIIEFPVKTMNIHDTRDLYQVDSGPVVFPDLSRRYPRPAESLRLAFVAFNAPGFADFVIEAPTPIPEGARVHHYSKLESFPAVNRLFACR
ncbi:MAG: hypothetical protein FJW32_10690 [Acidobacteria bacterium]|nr:hypothetical protein [Acidobacteriota bacterium]